MIGQGVFVMNRSAAIKKVLQRREEALDNVAIGCA